MEALCRVSSIVSDAPGRLAAPSSTARGVSQNSFDKFGNEQRHLHRELDARYDSVPENMTLSTGGRSTGCLEQTAHVLGKKKLETLQFGDLRENELWNL